MKALETIKPLLRSTLDFLGELSLFVTISAAATIRGPGGNARAV